MAEKPDAEPWRDVSFSMRMTPGEYDLLLKLAEALGTTKTGAVKQAIRFLWTRPETRKIAAARRALR